MRPKTRRRPSGFRRRREFAAARSRMPAAAPTRRSMISAWRRSAWPRLSRRRGPLPYRFTLTARAENYLWGRPDLKDTIKRLQAFQDAGADVLYAPGLKTREDIAAVVSSLDRPVNVVMGLQGVQLSLAELSADRRQAHQRRQFAQPRCAGRIRPGRAGNGKPGDIRLCRAGGLSQGHDARSSTAFCVSAPGSLGCRSF